MTKVRELNEITCSGVAALVHFLSSLRLDASVEKRSQSELEDALTTGGWQFQREYRLSNRDIVDFLIQVEGCHIALELKAKAQRKKIFRQLERYSMHDEVDAVVLLTGTAMQLPDAINGKPTSVASIGAGWL